MKREIVKKLRDKQELTANEIDFVAKEFTRDKKYGLVWEDHPEGVDLELKDGVFKIEELKDKKISMDPNGRENLLLEGDNLHSLMVLKEAGVKVDVIYIDPPYNTLKDEGFRYNDKRIDSNDNYRHSKWLSFMYKRLELARDLIEDDGVIFVSIDDNELYNLKLLMDQIFGEDNFVSNLIWVNKKEGRQIRGGMAKANEYIIMYSKTDLYKVEDIKLDDEESLCEYDREDEKGRYKKGHALYNLSGNFNIFNRPNLTYAIYYNPRTKEAYLRNEKQEGSSVLIQTDKEKDGFVRIVPIVRIQDGQRVSGCWRWSMEKFLNEYRDSLIIEKNTRGEWMIYTKDRLVDGAKRVKPTNIIDVPGSRGSRDLKKILKSNTFNHPKPTELVKWLIDRHQGRSITVLDFFAGSGTTGQAVMELNKEDGGNRRFILCTNNENNICEEITYERNKRVIIGEYAEEKAEPLPNNLSYYKVNIENIDDLNIYQKKEFDNYRSIAQILWKNDYKIVKEKKEFIEVRNLDENSIIIKLDTVDKEFVDNIDLNKFNKVYVKKHLSREKMFKGINESELIFY